MNTEAYGQVRDLAKAIKTLKQTQDEHEEYLKRIETRARQLLIDPLLEALGWDVRNPAQVHLEYQCTSGKPDYALFSHGNVVVLIEAKKLKKNFNDEQTSQLIKYTSDNTLTSLKYVVWTDGDHWQIWPVRGEERKKSFRLSNMYEADCAIEATLLLRSALEAEERGASSPAPAQTQPPASHDASVPPTPEPAKNGDWVPITLLKVESHQKAPASIRFSNSSPKSIKNWGDLLGSVAEHLVKTGRISAEDCPVPVINGKRHLLHTKATHPNGKKFIRSRKIGKLWLNTNFSSPDSHEHSCWLLKKFGIDPSTVLVSSNPS